MDTANITPSHAVLLLRQAADCKAPAYLELFIPQSSVKFLLLLSLGYCSMQGWCKAQEDIGAMLCSRSYPPIYDICEVSLLAYLNKTCAIVQAGEGGAHLPVL